MDDVIHRKATEIMELLEAIGIVVKSTAEELKAYRMQWPLGREAYNQSQPAATLHTVARAASASAQTGVRKSQPAAKLHTVSATLWTGYVDAQDRLW